MLYITILMNKKPIVIAKYTVSVFRNVNRFRLDAMPEMYSTMC